VRIASASSIAAPVLAVNLPAVRGDESSME
jgi:hypothetical protein